MNTRKWLIVFGLLVLCVGLGITPALAAAPYIPIYTSNNNFTMLDPSGAVAGGTNDVTFTWDGTLKTSVAVSLQVSNATIASVTVTATGLVSCPFNGFTWKAHDVAVYGPGSYTVKASCAARAPGCATGTNPITFTVGPDEIGTHMLFDWGTASTNKNIDVVNVWKKNVMFGPSAMWTGACGSNSANKAWDLMSKDPGTGINGYPMVDGGFVGFRANFNMMGAPINRPVDTLNNNFTMDQPDAVAFGGTNDVRFTWDGTKKTAVVASGQVSNASLSSPCAFFGQPWWSHDMVIYGPGTYSVYTDCPAGSPGCGLGVPYTFTVYPGELGVHTLFYWNGNEGIDVVNVWKPGSYDQGVNPATCTPAEFWAGACGTGDPAQVWDHMSYDWDGDCVNGAGMVDGPFVGMNANFNTTANCAFCGDCVPVDCNDNNACTTDVCKLGICEHTQLVCNDNNACTTDSCNIATGCVHTAVACPDDNNKCTREYCDTVRGCTFDETMCLTGYCDPATGTCREYCPLGCNDNNACTIDNCMIFGPSEPGMCVYTQRICNDNSACTTDTCNTATGCVFTPVNCSDNNLCTIDSCNSATGCLHTPVICVSGFCDPLTGQCCLEGNDPRCNDNNVCTTDSLDCATGLCKHVINNTLCPPLTGNNFSMIQPDNNVFGGTNDVTFAWDGTKRTSVAVSGQVSNALLSSPCSFFGVTWAAHDVTVYGPGTYTVYTDCPAGSPGCGTGAPINFTVLVGQIGVHMLFDWNGNLNIDVVNVMMPNAVSTNMWTGACSSNLAIQPWNWASYDFDGDGVNGTPMVDGPFVGMNANFNLSRVCGGCGCINCNDNNACTADVCSTTTGTCEHTPIVCNDNNACTADSCDPATGCVFTPKNCDDNNKCTTDSCNTATGACVNTAINCNDNNACTLDACDPTTGCLHTPIPCNDNNACTTDTCNPVTGCVYTPKDCNDNNVCTIDSCTTATGACINTAIVCNDNNACTIDTCNTATGCVYTPRICNDNDACTTDSCNSANGACVYAPKVIDDNSRCTIDACDPATGNVTHTPIMCNDNNACTIDSCNATTGCVFTPRVCDDGNACTADSCDPTTGACVYAAVPDGAICPGGCGTCLSGICMGYSPCCQAGSVKSVTIRGGGQKPTTVDRQIQTNFTVVNGGCIVASTASTVTCNPGTILLVNVKAGTGPMPTSCTWKGAPISTDMQFTVTCPATSGDVGKLICDNKLGGGKDSDKMTITVQ